MQQQQAATNMQTAWKVDLQEVVMEGLLLVLLYNKVRLSVPLELIQVVHDFPNWISHLP